MGSVLVLALVASFAVDFGYADSPCDVENVGRNCTRCCTRLNMVPSEFHLKTCVCRKSLTGKLTQGLKDKFDDYMEKKMDEARMASKRGL